MGGGWSAASEPSMTTIGTEIWCGDHWRAQRVTAGTLIIWSKVSRRSFGFVNTEAEDFHLDPATDQSQKMTNFKLTSLSLFLKQINHYNNIHRRVSELIRCREIKVGWFSLSHQPPARAAGQSRHRRITPEFSDLIKVSAGAKL